ncbi:MAG: DUF1667 domain-containing protein [Thermoproteota archaeon]
MSEERKVICIVCPMGCEIEVFMGDKGNIEIKGASCIRGNKYAAEEVREPKRHIFSVIRVKGGDLPVVSVVTSKPVPKELIPRIMEELAKIEIEAPVEVGQVVTRNVVGTGTDIIATRPARKRVSKSNPFSR